MKSITMTFTVLQWRLISVACALDTIKRVRSGEPTLADNLELIARAVAKETGKYDIKGELKADG